MNYRRDSARYISTFPILFLRLCASLFRVCARLCHKFIPVRMVRQKKIEVIAAAIESLSAPKRGWAVQRKTECALGAYKLNPELGVSLRWK